MSEPLLASAAFGASGYNEWRWIASPQQPTPSGNA